MAACRVAEDKDVFWLELELLRQVKVARQGVEQRCGVGRGGGECLAVVYSWGQSRLGEFGLLQRRREGAEECRRGRGGRRRVDRTCPGSKGRRVVGRSRKGSPQLVRSVLRRVSTEQSPGPARGYVRPQDPACATSSHSNRQRKEDRGPRDPPDDALLADQPEASPSQA